MLSNESRLAAILLLAVMLVNTFRSPSASSSSPPSLSVEAPLGGMSGDSATRRLRPERVRTEERLSEAGVGDVDMPGMQPRVVTWFHSTPMPLSHDRPTGDSGVIPVRR